MFKLAENSHEQTDDGTWIAKKGTQREITKTQFIENLKYKPNKKPHDQYIY